MERLMMLFLFLQFGIAKSQVSTAYIDSIAQSQKKIQISFTKEQIGQEVEVELSFKNVTENEIYISNGYNYGAYFDVDSLIMFDAEYYNNSNDWLIMPSFPLPYRRLLPNEVWKTKKSKKSNGIKRVYISFNIIEVRESISDEFVKNLQEGFITTEQLFDDKLENYFEIIDLKFE